MLATSMSRAHQSLLSESGRPLLSDRMGWFDHFRPRRFMKNVSVPDVCLDCVDITQTTAFCFLFLADHQDLLFRVYQRLFP